MPNAADIIKEEIQNNYSIKNEKSTFDDSATGEKIPNTKNNKDALYDISISKRKIIVNTSNEKKSRDLSGEEVIRSDDSVSGMN